MVPVQEVRCLSRVCHAPNGDTRELAQGRKRDDPKCSRYRAACSITRAAIEMEEHGVEGEELREISCGKQACISPSEMHA
eukprot:6191969-Pleurochrysis_carterae.AAC.3